MTLKNMNTFSKNTITDEIIDIMDFTKDVTKEEVAYLSAIGGIRIGEGPTDFEMVIVKSGPTGVFGEILYIAVRTRSSIDRQTIRSWGIKPQDKILSNLLITYLKEYCVMGKNILIPVEAVEFGEYIGGEEEEFYNRDLKRLQFFLFNKGLLTNFPGTN
jgi:hypothetical protein